MSAIRRFHITSAFLCLAAVGATGCGEVLTAADSGPGDTIDAGAGSIDADVNRPDAMPADPCTGDVAIEDMGDCYLTALCEIYNRCLGLFPSVQACVDTGGPFGGGGDPLVGLKRIIDAADAGKVVYHADRAGQCIGGFRTITCEELFTEGDNVFSACQDTFEGTVAGGGSCYETEECAAAGADCQQTACSMQCCLGTCVDPVGLGQLCDNADCVDGAECVRNPNTNESRCETGETNAPCQSEYDCDRAYWCDNPAGTTLGVCKADFPSAANCTEDAQCPGAEKCIGDDLNPPLAIGTCAKAIAVGDPCDGSCDGPLWCDNPDTTTAGTCKELPGLNGDCAATNGSCAGLLWCDSTTDTCKARLPMGSACTSNNQCQQPLFCSADLPGGTSPGTCTAPQSNGSLCDSQRHCDSSICRENGGVNTCQEYQNCY